MIKKEVQDTRYISTCVIIRTYNRSEMLLALLKELHGNVDCIMVFDDGSDYDYSEHAKYCQYSRNKRNYGKKEHYKMWRKSFNYAKQNKYDLYIFMPDDFSRVNIDTIKKIHSEFTFNYAYNIINDGRTRCWNNEYEYETVISGRMHKIVYFVDCGFFCNRKTLELLDYKIDEVPPEWFDSENKSSGVGFQLTYRLNLLNINMFLPTRSLAYHGTHDSMMHYEERKRNPLISK